MTGLDRPTVDELKSDSWMSRLDVRGRTERTYEASAVFGASTGAAASRYASARCCGRQDGHLRWNTACVSVYEPRIWMDLIFAVETDWVSQGIRSEILSMTDELKSSVILSHWGSELRTADLICSTSVNWTREYG